MRTDLELELDCVENGDERPLEVVIEGQDFAFNLTRPTEPWFVAHGPAS